MLDRLEAFAAGGFTLQAPHGRAALALAAALCLTGGTGERPAPHAGASGRMAEGAYARLVDAMQDEADLHLGFGRVTILDRSSTPEAERARIAERLPGPEAPAHVQPASWQGPAGSASTFPLVGDGEAYAMTRPFGVPDGMTCLVVGASPGATSGEIAGGLVAPARDLGDVSATGVQRWMLWREVGRCIGAASDLAADTFAALMARRAPDGAGVAEAMARELSLTDPQVGARREAALAAAGRIEAADLGWEAAARAAVRVSSRFESVQVLPDAPRADPAPEASDDDPEVTASLPAP